MKLYRYRRDTLLTGGVVVLILGGVLASTVLFLTGQEVAALLVSNFLVVSGVGLTSILLVRVGRRHNASSRSRRREHREIQTALERGAGTGASGGQNSVERLLGQLEERQDHLHSLTRKRLREKHNAVEASLSRMRRRDYEHYATVKQRIESVAKEQSRQAGLLIPDSKEFSKKGQSADADGTALRAFLFEILESQAYGRAFGAPAEGKPETER